MTFADHFGARAAAYRRHRPGYPPELFAYLAALAPRRGVAWDCGTGSGQAAVGLAAHFARVVATDASEAQVAEAEPNERVEYRAAPAEASGLAGASADLVAAAQAVHWFNRPAFYREARRVLRPGGVIAVWTYDDPALDDPRLDAAVRRLNHETLADHWPPERAIVRDGYRTIDFPFAELAPPRFAIERAWTLGELAGYLRTWSATARYVAARGDDPVRGAEAELAAAWGAEGARHLVRWPISMRVGRVG